MKKDDEIELARVDFTDILHAAFTSADFKSAKKSYVLTVFFAHLESMCIKAAYKTLMKLTPVYKSVSTSSTVKSELSTTWP